MVEQPLIELEPARDDDLEGGGGDGDTDHAGIRSADGETCGDAAEAQCRIPPSSAAGVPLKRFPRMMSITSRMLKLSRRTVIKGSGF
jgi:hypothetical protein